MADTALIVGLATVVGTAVPATLVALRPYFEATKAAKKASETVETVQEVSDEAERSKDELLEEYRTVTREKDELIASLRTRLADATATTTGETP